MASPLLPREGAWVGGLMTDGFSVQCRADQDCTLSVQISQETNFASLVGTIATETVVTGHHWRGTAHVTGLTENTQYYWRISLDNSVDAVTYGTETTNTAGKLKTLSSRLTNWSACYLGCVPWWGLQWDIDTLRMHNHWTTLLAQNLDFHFHGDDIIYSDISGSHPAWPPTDYAIGEFADPNDSATPDADATIARYRMNFMNTYSGMENLGALANGAGGLRKRAMKNVMAEFKAKVPGYYMIGDHDLAYNDCSDRVNQTGARLTRWTTGRDSTHEYMMSLNKALVDAESGRTFTPYSSWDMYHYIDIPPCRFVMLDTRSFRDSNVAVDNPSKSYLGAAQLAWLKNLIDTNTQKYLVIIASIMLDGYHGWNKSTVDGLIGASYERDEWMNYIYTNGNPYRTIVIAGDTHESGVFKYVNNGEKPPIYELLAGNSGWASALHGWVDGLKAGASGNGTEMEAMWVGGIGFVKLEAIGGNLRASIVLTDSAIDGGHTPGIKWSKTFI